MCSATTRTKVSMAVVLQQRAHGVSPESWLTSLRAQSDLPAAPVTLRMSMNPKGGLGSAKLGDGLLLVVPGSRDSTVHSRTRLTLRRKVTITGGGMKSRMRRGWLCTEVLRQAKKPCARRHEVLPQLRHSDEPGRGHTRHDVWCLCPQAPRGSRAQAGEAGLGVPH